MQRVQARSSVSGKRRGYVETWTDAQGNRHRRARIRLGDGSRTRVPLPDGYGDARAQEAAASLQEQEDQHGKLLAAKCARTEKDAPRVNTAEADAWFDAWIKARQARGITSTHDNDSHYRHHIRPVLGTKHVREWTTADLRGLVASLDEKIATGALSHKSAGNIFGTATKMAADACRSKLPALRVRDDNPALGVEGPDGGADREKQFLYPSEFLRLVACEDVALRWRRAIALAVYLFLRAGELRALRWEAVDLEHGTVHIHEAFERRSRTAKSTKTKRGRRFAFEPAILPLLEAMHAQAGGEGLVCPLPNRMADRLRGWLARAGVTRRELLDEKSATTKPLGFHDLRATGLTWMAVRGDDPLKIMQSALATRTFRRRRFTSARPRPSATASAMSSRHCRLRCSAPKLARPRFVGPSRRPTRPGSSMISERDTGFEPATSSLGSQSASAQSAAVIRLVPWPWVAKALAVPPCFTVSLRERTPAGVYTGDAIMYPGELVWS